MTRLCVCEFGGKGCLCVRERECEREQCLLCFIAGPTVDRLCGGGGGAVGGLRVGVCVGEGGGGGEVYLFWFVGGEYLGGGWGGGGVRACVCVCVCV